MPSRAIGAPAIAPANTPSDTANPIVTTVAIIQALHRRGLRVPEDIAIAGSGNAEEGRHCFPQLTTIGPQRPSLQKAVGRLLDEIEGEADGPAQTFEIPWSMIGRESA